MKYLFGVFMVLLAVTLVAQPTAAQDRVYVSIPGVVGESNDSNHMQWIDAYGISHDSDLPITFGGGGPQIGQADLGDIFILKGTDISSPPLQQRLNQGIALPNPVVIDVCREPSGGSQECYYTLTLTGAYVRSIQLSGSSCVDPLTSCVPSQTESVGFTFTTIQYISRAFSNGQPTGSTCSCWNLQTASSCSCP